MSRSHSMPWPGSCADEDRLRAMGTSKSAIPGTSTIAKIVVAAAPWRIVASGTPEDVAKVKESYTGQYLKELLGRRSASRAKRQAAE